MTPAEHLAALPEPVQSEAWTVIRSIAGMDTDEKATALAAMNGTAEALFGLVLTGSTKHKPGLELFAAIGELIQQMHVQANPEKEDVCGLA